MAVITFEGVLTDEQHRQMLAAMAFLREHRERYVVVLDSTRGAATTSEQRQAVVKHLRETSADLRTWCAGIAFVMPSPAVRGALVAVTWFIDLPFPFKVVSTLDEGRAWAQNQLSRRVAEGRVG
jgi:ribosomal protein S15P/S13E